ncbi:MAG: L,D-transpeptidase family protein [Dokdonella sp.]
MRCFTALVALLFASIATAIPFDATKIRVNKSERRLDVYAGERIMASYEIRLGSPEGSKRREGDRRTPEGNYLLDYKNSNSAYHKSIHISYPSETDRAAARKMGVRPGGDIMIHGQPNDLEMQARLKAYPLADWTDGCIALSNKDMDALWSLVKVPIPIHITP